MSREGGKSVGLRGRGQRSDAKRVAREGNMEANKESGLGEQGRGEARIMESKGRNSGRRKGTEGRQRRKRSVQGLK